MITENRKTFNRERETSPTIRHKNPANWHVLLLVDPFEKITQIAPWVQKSTLNTSK